MHGAGLKVLEALDMLADELPAELSFHIPESYHRRIIGKGGASVQDVMRRHSAFVKFSSTEQWATFGGHHRESSTALTWAALIYFRRQRGQRHLHHAEQEQARTGCNEVGADEFDLDKGELR